MKHIYDKRLAALEAQAHPPFPVPDDLSTLTDDELEAVSAWCDRIHGPRITHAIESLSDAELESLVQMDDASAEAYIQERL